MVDLSIAVTGFRFCIYHMHHQSTFRSVQMLLQPHNLVSEGILKATKLSGDEVGNHVIFGRCGDDLDNVSS